MMDKDHNGTISRDELLRGYRKLYAHKLNDAEIVK
jgi:Ca2+-binding EF-hand superfamily protein